MEIRIVCLDFPLSEQGEQRYFEVGKLGVTEIKKNERPGEFCMIPYYEIYVDGVLKHEMHQYGYVQYFENKTKLQ